jgi:hypothetical protein
MMKLLKIESSKLTPGIVIDPDRSVLEIYGFSLPENASEFYRPVLTWLSDFQKELVNNPSDYKEFNVIFKLVYFNSSSLRQIVEMFQFFHAIQEMKFPICVTWQYDSEDPQMAESGKEMGDITKVAVNIVAYN